MNQTIKDSSAVFAIAFFTVALPCLFGAELALVLPIFFAFAVTIIGVAWWVTPRQAMHRMTTEDKEAFDRSVREVEAADEINRCLEEDARLRPNRRSFFRAKKPCPQCGKSEGTFNERGFNRCHSCGYPGQ